MIDRRSFLRALPAVAVTTRVAGDLRRAVAAPAAGAAFAADVVLAQPRLREDVFAYLRREHGKFDAASYGRVLGAANEFKEGDRLIGVAAADDASRRHARALLIETTIEQIDAHPLRDDELHRLSRRHLDVAAAEKTAGWKLGKLLQFLLHADETEIKAIMPGLSSDVIGCVVKLMNDHELIAVGAKVFNALPGSRIGARGYLGARIQPNSPTDNVSDIQWQVFDGWSYAVGDVVLGNNPVSSNPTSVAAIERTLHDLLVTFELENVLPHCVLAHIDVQAAVEKSQPHSTGIWFQSIAGSDAANATFDINVRKMLAYADRREGRFGLYFETGQGADFTNGHGHGYDMVLHESRKYGFARALAGRVGAAQLRAGREYAPWVHLNDVAGFIGPEVFRTREQLVRCCLEDIVMGKLHGLCLGLDVCSTLHMDVSLDDLDWCLDRIMPANPAYLMALPTKIDPMLGYLTTGFQDHVRLRKKFGYRIDDRMLRFFQDLGVVDHRGEPTPRFGDPLWVYLRYQRKKGDARNDDEIVADGRRQLEAVRSRGVFISSGFGASPEDLTPLLDQQIRRIYTDAKACLWATLTPEFVAAVPLARRLSTRSADRTDYILHPETGERLSPESRTAVLDLRRAHDGRYDVQIVVSDGLNALSISDPGHLAPFLIRLRDELLREGYRPAPEHLVVTSGRVRAGYRIGETLFGDLSGRRAVLHVIGERPGSGHHTFSVYITAAPGKTWREPDKVDHNITKVVSGIAATAILPIDGADETVRILKTLV
jgi:ethanolamine ammonia-lyase large subunit